MSLHTGVLVFLLCACSRNGSSEPPVGPDRPVDAGTATPAPMVSGPSSAPTATGCAADKDCGYDDPCMAKTCVLHPAPFVGCDKSSIPTFDCRCNTTTHACEMVKK